MLQWDKAGSASRAAGKTTMTGLTWKPQPLHRPPSTGERGPLRRRWPLSALAVALLAAVAAGGCSPPKTDRAKRARIEELFRRYQRSFPDTPHVTVAELRAAMQSADVVLVDVREERERRVSMIPGAISAKQFEANPSEYRGRRIIAYCTIGYRSGMYAKKLRGQGWQVANLKGSILAWTHAGQEVVNESGPTRRVHVWGRKWDLLPAGYEAVW